MLCVNMLYACVCVCVYTVRVVCACVDNVVHNKVAHDKVVGKKMCVCVRVTQPRVTTLCVCLFVTLLCVTGVCQAFM